MIVTSVVNLPHALGAERAVILHVDDLGMCHGANRSLRSLAAQGYVTCSSVMVPCPWFCEIAETAAADPALDLGVHLTLTGEWARYPASLDRGSVAKIPPSKDFSCATGEGRVSLRLSRIRLRNTFRKNSLDASYRSFSARLNSRNRS